jgi:hypothetical protein
MPSVSQKQKRFMAACSHGSGYASCPPMKVSKDFNAADVGTERLTGAGGLVQKGGYMAKKLPY